MDTTINDDQPMSLSLSQRRQSITRQCTQEAQKAGTMLLFGMTTSLMLQSVPIPDGCRIDSSILHTVSSSKKRRMRIRNGGILLNHVWQPLSLAHNLRINQHIYALDLFHTWAQLSPYLPLESLIALGDAIVTATARQPLLAKERTSEQIHHDLSLFLRSMPKFKGKGSCAKALTLIRPNVDSPKETDTYLMMLAHGLPKPMTNHIIPNATFRSGVPMTLDLAWPEYQVAVEYDGDHHRTDKNQWRRDQEKRNHLRARNWHIAIATGDTLANATSRAEFVFPIARQLALRGAEFTFRVVAMTIEQVIRERARDK